MASDEVSGRRPSQAATQDRLSAVHSTRTRLPEHLSRPRRCWSRGLVRPGTDRLAPDGQAVGEGEMVLLDPWASASQLGWGRAAGGEERGVGGVPPRRWLNVPELCTFKAFLQAEEREGPG